MNHQSPASGLMVVKKMGLRKNKNKALPLRQSLPRRCKEKNRPGSGIYEEKERVITCRVCGETAFLRNPNFKPLSGERVIISKKETAELPCDVDIECAICLNSFQYKRMLLLSCNHRFHKKCITQWFKTDVRCPLCRK
ncbi:e3 ubiquitin-protein ligase ATL6 [Trichonephila clavata]|uniref:E3 ubiquitin-protein ligase ATL6 n=1 Tax=Trichonephila clavata TaxID=2740835 RepID=A0A8X6GN08_TRICU|nr:e3 ubiquitin-protein ligase ATL6 [Trichonephila clavata]